MPAVIGGNKMKEPHLPTEMFFSMFKWFLVIFVITNLIWAGLFIHYVNKTVSENTDSVEVMQDGYNNNQSVTNG